MHVCFDVLWVHLCCFVLSNLVTCHALLTGWRELLYWCTKSKQRILTNRGYGFYDNLISAGRLLTSGIPQVLSAGRYTVVYRDSDFRRNPGRKERSSGPGLATSAAVGLVVGRCQIHRNHVELRFGPDSRENLRQSDPVREGQGSLITWTLLACLEQRTPDPWPEGRRKLSAGKLG